MKRFTIDLQDLTGYRRYLKRMKENKLIIQGLTPTFARGRWLEDENYPYLKMTRAQWRISHGSF
jgi:hypothetical protein